MYCILLCVLLYFVFYCILLFPFCVVFCILCFLVLCIVLHGTYDVVDTVWSVSQGMYHIVLQVVLDCILYCALPVLCRILRIVLCGIVLHAQ